MTLKIRILRFLRKLLIILVSLIVKLISEIMLISTRCIHGFMSNLIKKSWTVSSLNGVMGLNPVEFGWKLWIFWSFLTSKAVALNMGVMAELIRSCLSSILVGSHIRLGWAQVLIRGLFNIMLGISLAYLLRK